jgi:hypothetical protein
MLQALGSMKSLIAKYSCNNLSNTEDEYNTKSSNYDAGVVFLACSNIRFTIRSLTKCTSPIKSFFSKY